jgi:hypothetical protein
MKKLRTVFLGLLVSVMASAGVVGYVNNPTTNSGDFATAVASLGGSLTTITFDTHPLGPLQSAFYSGLGVTLTGTGGFTNVVNGVGPGQSNLSGTPISAGEGVHASSNYVGDGGSGGLTVSFGQGVLGVGLFTIDLFNPADQPTTRNDVTIQAFSGPGGTGTSLGLFHAAQFNFQPNGLYFMGVTSSAGDIRSVVFNDLANTSQDIIGLDNLRFAAQAAPEPSTLLMLSGGLAALLARKLRRC